MNLTKLRDAYLNRFFLEPRDKFKWLSLQAEILRCDVCEENKMTDEVREELWAFLYTAQRAFEKLSDQ
jgi:hypothetical protein